MPFWAIRRGTYDRQCWKDIEMRVDQITMLRFMDGADKRFVIPVYQRSYSWKRNNCKKLLDDLREVYSHDRQSHFFGSVVFVAENDGSCEEQIIIDGQQRITTVSLLLLAIRNYLLANPDMETKNINAEKIKNVYLTDKYADDDEKKLKLKLVEGDDSAYDALLERKRPIEDTNITANYSYFYAEIEKMSAEELNGVYQAIAKLDVVSISLQPHDGDDPQLIFESLNSTGLDLETADKIRNYVLMNMKHKEQERFYKTYWEPLEQTVGHSEINKFVRYYLASKTRHLYDEKKLYFEFKYYCEDSELSIEAILQDMLEYAGYYKEIIAPDERNASSDVLKRINRLDVKTCVPLMLDLFKARSNDAISDAELCQALEIIESYIIRREICGLPTNLLNKLFVRIGAEIDRDVEKEGISYYDALCRELLSKTGRSRFPNDHEFRENFELYDLYDAKPTTKKYILERLEQFDNKEPVDVERFVDDKRLTIEHIMPQTLSAGWKKQLGENWELIQTKYLNTPGNLTLTGYNPEYSNASFERKKTMPGKGFQYSPLRLNEYVKTCESWGEEQIKKRAELLYRKAEKIWWLPSVASLDLDQEGGINAGEKPEWISWDEDTELTGKLVTSVEVLGMLIQADSMTDAYRKIHSALFELDPATYYSSGFPWFTKEKSDLREPHKLADSAYIELNKSSQSKLNAIKDVCEVMGLDSDDVRLLVEWRNRETQLDSDVAN